MSTSQSLRLPDYQTFSDSIAVLSLPLSSSELHGTLCGYLCADASHKGEAYLQALMLSHPHESKKAAFLSLFDVYAISQQQIQHLDFQFEMMLPPEHEPLIERARAFGEWCEGFSQALVMAGIDHEQIPAQETWDAIQHISEFAQLDYESLHMDNDEEKALIDVSEYTRMAVLSIHTDIKKHQHNDHLMQKAH